MSIIDKKMGDSVEIKVDNISLAGDVAVELKEKTISIIDSGVIKIRLDLEKPEYIDSSGIGKLLFMNKKIEKIGGEFSIVRINGTLYEFLQSLAITQVMKIAEPF